MKKINKNKISNKSATLRNFLLKKPAINKKNKIYLYER